MSAVGLEDAREAVTRLAGLAYCLDPLKDVRHRDAAAARELADWLKWLELGNKAARTLALYERTAAAVLRAFPDKQFADITDGDLLHVLALFPPASRNQRKIHLNSWFKWGLKTRRLASNPVDFLPDIRHRVSRDYDLFSDAEAEAVCALPAPDGQLATLMFWTGIRLAEARGLTGKRLDVARQQLLVVDGAKGSKSRRVPMLDRVTIAATELLTLEGIGPDDFVWYTRDGGAKRHRHVREVSDQCFYDWWHRALDEAGVRYRRPHMTRHTFATRMKELGLPVDEVSQILGHESVRTTMDIYVHQSIDAIGVRMRELAV